AGNGSAGCFQNRAAVHLPVFDPHDGENPSGRSAPLPCYPSSPATAWDGKAQNVPRSENEDRSPAVSERFVVGSLKAVLLREETCPSSTAGVAVTPAK